MELRLTLGLLRSNEPLFSMSLRSKRRGCKVESVESDTRGFDLISRFALAVDGKAVETRFIEVKGRAGVGEIALTANEYKTA